MTSVPPFDPLAQARARLGTREEDFITACAEYWPLGGRSRRRRRERVSRSFNLSWYHLELLEQHFKPRLDAARALRAGGTSYAAHTHPKD